MLEENRSFNNNRSEIIEDKDRGIVFSVLIVVLILEGIYALYRIIRNYNYILIKLPWANEQTTTDNKQGVSEQVETDIRILSERFG